MDIQIKIMELNIELAQLKEQERTLSSELESAEKAREKAMRNWSPVFHKILDLKKEIEFLERMQGKYSTPDKPVHPAEIERAMWKSVGATTDKPASV